MIISHDREKLFNMIIYFVQKTKKCFKTKLFKLFYNADFMHFKETGRSISGLDYAAWKKGPVPPDLFHEFKKPKEDFKRHIQLADDEGKCKIIPKIKFDDKYFTERELQILQKVAYIFKDADTDLMVETTHLKNQPWDKTIKTKGEGKKIDYILAFDHSPESLTEKEYQEKLAETKETERIFSS